MKQRISKSARKNGMKSKAASAPVKAKRRARVGVEDLNELVHMMGRMFGASSRTQRAAWAQNSLSIFETCVRLDALVSIVKARLQIGEQEWNEALAGARETSMDTARRADQSEEEQIEDFLRQFNGTEQ